MAFDHQRIIDALDHWIVDRSARVILLFLVLTAVFAVGLTNISTTAGTQQFSENVPAQNALTAINDKFQPPFARGTGQTQLIQRDRNVLAKPALLRMLHAQKALADRTELRVTDTRSAARIVATTLDPSATTLHQQITTVQQATPGQIDHAVRTAATANPAFTQLLSDDFNRRSATAGATIGVVQHAIPAQVSSQAGQGGSSPFTPIQLEARAVVASQASDITVFGSGIISSEFANVIGDSLIIVVPAAVILILIFLIVAYRDLVDLLLGMVSLAMAIIWTFGFMGLAGISFSQLLIAVPPLLLAVGIDYGIHAINRYREERALGQGMNESMRLTTDQLLVAFFMVTMTTVIGFLSNLSSALGPIQDFGVVASIGIVFVFLIFGVFLPALKVAVDRQRDRFPIPTFSQAPIGSEGSTTSRLLSGGVVAAKKAPLVIVLVALLVTAGGGVYAQHVSTSFSNEDFLPPAHTPAYLAVLPEPFKPHDYTVTRDINYLEDHFTVSQQDTVEVYVQGPMAQPYALEQLYRAGHDPPPSFVSQGRDAKATSIVTVIQQHAAQDPQFARLVTRNDMTGNGVPDRHLGTIYDRLFASNASDQAAQYLTPSHRQTRVVYSVKSSAAQDAIASDARTVAGRYRYEATATGNTVVFQSISDLILQSAIRSLAISIVGTSVFLVLIFWLLEGRPSLGLANVVPILVTVTMVAASMRALGIAFNAITATILAITIGMGIDYSTHVVHRFSDEYGPDADPIAAIQRTVLGTGGALMGSMLTTVFGIGVLVLSIFPAIGQFGVLTGLSILYSFLSSLFILPSVLAVWARWAG